MGGRGGLGGGRETGEWTRVFLDLNTFGYRGRS